MPEPLHLAVALDGSGWHPAAWREPAARVAPLTSSIGLVPTAVVTHTEPFHVSKAIATLDYVSRGRAGLRVKLSASAAEWNTSAASTFRSIGPPTLRHPKCTNWFPTCSTRPPTMSRWSAAVGQLGGRRRDPRRRHRPVHRPEQAALHRFSQQVPVGQGGRRSFPGHPRDNRW